jgi:N-acetylneuraminic acid mutarotase
LLLSAVFAVAAGAQAQGKWTQGPAIPEGANEVIGAAVNGQILVYGGQDTKSAAMGIFWKLDPASGQWTKLPSNPVPVHHAAAVSIGSRMYVVGGFRLPDGGKGGWYPENKLWMFDLDKQTWTRLPDMPTPRGALAATVADGKIYAIGGARIPDGAKIEALSGGGPVELLGTVEVFDTRTNTWSTLRSMPTPRNHMDASHVDGRIYVIGGRVGSCFSGGWSTNVFMNEAYDIATDTWATRAPMPTARSGAGSAIVDGRISVLGGEGWLDDFGGVFRTHEVYDPKSNTWSRAARMMTPRHGFAIAAVGRRIYAVSGVNNAGGAGTLSVINFTEIYEP